MLKRKNLKKKKCRKPEECFPLADTSRVLSALDERIKDFESRGRSRKKAKTPKPIWKRASSTPSKVVPHFHCKSQDQLQHNKSVRFNNCCGRGGHLDMSPPPCAGKSAMKSYHHGDNSYKYKHASKSFSSNNFSGSGETSSGTSICYTPNCSSCKLYSGYSCSSGNSAPTAYNFHANDSLLAYKNRYINTSKNSSSDRNWKFTLKLDELMNKYNEFDCARPKAFTTSMEKKTAYGDFKSSAQDVSRRRYTSPYKSTDYTTPAFSKYSSYYGDGVGQNNVTSGTYNQDRFRSDAFRSINDNKSYYSNDVSLPSAKTDWMSGTSYSADTQDKSKLKEGGRDWSQNKYTPSLYSTDKLMSSFYLPSKPKLMMDDPKKLTDPSKSFDFGLAKYKTELFSKTNIFSPAVNCDAAVMSTLASDYQRMDFFRKTMQSQREKNLELMEKYVFGKPRLAANNYMCNTNENRKKYEQYLSDTSSTESIRKNDSSSKPSDWGTGWLSRQARDEANNMSTYHPRSRSLSSLPGGGTTLGFLDQHGSNAWGQRSLHQRGSSLDSLTLRYGKTLDTTPSWTRGTPDMKSQPTGNFSDRPGTRSPSMDRETLRQGQNILDKFSDRYSLPRTLSPARRPTEQKYFGLADISKPPGSIAGLDYKRPSVKTIDLGKIQSMDFQNMYCFDRPLAFSNNYSDKKTDTKSPISDIKRDYSSTAYSFSNNYSDKKTDTKSPISDIKRDYISSAYSFSNNYSDKKTDTKSPISDIKRDYTISGYSFSNGYCDKKSDSKCSVGDAKREYSTPYLLPDYKASRSTSYPAPTSDYTSLTFKDGSEAKTSGAPGPQLEGLHSKLALGLCLDDETKRLMTLNSIISKTTMKHGQAASYTDPMLMPDKSKEAVSPDGKLFYK